MKAKQLAFVCCLLLLLVSPVVACYWDYDTLQMEREDFPTTLEMVTGKFLRHSEAYYRWRIENRLSRIEEGRYDPRVYDDLAVAYDKTGQHDKAIETILLNEKNFPGRYETAANLGTFFIHSGQFQKGAEHIARAIEINPDAHFGREIYQKILVEYVLTTMQDGKVRLPLSAHRSHEADLRRPSFASFVLQQRGLPPEQSEEEISKAIKGVLGMMRFGHYDSPVLLEVLGDLLARNSSRLAARAFLKASYEVKDAAAAEAYRKLASNMVSVQKAIPGSDEVLSLNELEKTFQTELKEAGEWYAEVEADEAAWVESGADVDAEFTKKYYAEPKISGGTVDQPDSAAAPASDVPAAILRIGGICLVILVTCLVVGCRLLWSRRMAARS